MSSQTAAFEVCLIMLANAYSSKGAASSIRACDALPWLHKCEENGYDKMMAPMSLQGQTTPVGVQIYVESMGNFRAGTMDYDMDIYFLEFWKDERLRHNHSDYVMFNSWNQINRLWVPDLYFANSKTAEYNYVTVPNLVLRIYPNGDIRYSVRINLKVSCHMVLMAYPLDNQRCNLKIITYGTTQDIVHVRWVNQTDAIGINKDIKFTDLKVYNTSWGYCDGSYFNLTFSCLLAEFALERNIGYSLLQVYLPTTFIVVISWISFWIDPTSVPGRVGLAVTTLLTLSTQAIGFHYQLPPVSYAKAQDIWFAVCILFLFAGLVEFALVNMYTRRCNDMVDKQKSADYNKRTGALHGLMLHAADETGAECSDSLVLEPNNPLVLNKDWLYARRAAVGIDKYSRIIFPTAFVVFGIIYSCTYIMLTGR